MQLKKIKPVGVAILLSLVVTGGVVSTSLLRSGDCSEQRLSRGEADRITTERLKAYCEMESLSASQFSPPQVSSVDEVPWIFDYTSNTSPRHFVRIHIDSCGVVELSREIYSQ